MTAVKKHQLWTQYTAPSGKQLALDFVTTAAAFGTLPSLLDGTSHPLLFAVIVTPMVGSTLAALRNRLFSFRPALLVADDGLTFRGWGFIAWSDVAVVRVQPHRPGRPAARLIVEPRDLAAFLRALPQGRHYQGRRVIDLDCSPLVLGTMTTRVPILPILDEMLRRNPSLIVEGLDDPTMPGVKKPGAPPSPRTVPEPPPE